MAEGKDGLIWACCAGGKRREEEDGAAMVVDGNETFVDGRLDGASTPASRLPFPRLLSCSPTNMPPPPQAHYGEAPSVWQKSKLVALHGTAAH